MKDLQALITRLRERGPGLELRENEPMSRHTSFRVGGPVALMALPKSLEEVSLVLATAAVEFGIKPFFMGKGTNLLFSDQGADLLVVKACDGLNRLELEEEGKTRDASRPNGRTIVAESGVSLARLAQFALEHGLTGLEFAQGIPGSVGGAVTMNAGAYGGEMSQVVTCVSADGLPLEELVRTRKDSEFSYRHSAYQSGDEFIRQVWFTLDPGDPAEIRAKMEDLARRRREKQPLEWPSAGSTFKRPAPVDGKPVYAAALIEQCGLKGLSVGGAQVSEKHAGFLINKGGATAGDILTLMEQVKRRVREQTGVELEPEVRIIGNA